MLFKPSMMAMVDLDPLGMKLSLGRDPHLGVSAPLGQRIQLPARREPPLLKHGPKLRYSFVASCPLGTSHQRLRPEQDLLRELPIPPVHEL